MAKNQDEEIADADGDKEIDSAEEEEDTEEESDSKDSKDEDDEDEDDDSDEEDSDEEDSDDEDSQPITRGELKKILAQSGKNRSAAAERLLSKRKLSNAERSKSQKETERLDRIENRQTNLEKLEEKRQFGYANSLAPDEVDVVFRLTKRPTTKSLNDPVIKGALDGYRNAKRAKENTPRTNARPDRGGSRSKDERPLSSGERRDKFADRRREILSNKERR